MKLLILYQDSQRGWGKRIGNFISEQAPGSWELNLQKIPVINVPVIDNPDKFLPDGLPQTNLLLVLAESSGIAQLIPDLAAVVEADAVLVPVDFRDVLPRGLGNQVNCRLEEMNTALALPEPFCSLTPEGLENGYLQTFARKFGKPEMTVEIKDGVIENVAVKRSSPCGGSCFVAGELPGVNVEEAARQAGLLHQYYPCLADVDIIHTSAYLTEAAVKIAVKERTGNVKNRK